MADIQEGDDWELHRKGVSDQERHKRRIRRAIRDNPSEILEKQDIITRRKNKKVKVPLKSLKEYRFRYAQRQQAVGQGSGEEGDTIAKRSEDGDGEPAEEGGMEGEGEDIFETEVDLEEVKRIIFDELELPNLDETRKKEMKDDDTSFTSRSDQGVIPNLDKRKTIKENLKRRIARGEDVDINRDDLRYRTYKDDEKPTTNAVVYLIRDASGSMRKKKKLYARSLAWWLVEFLRTQYSNVKAEFILHTTKANKTDEQAFFERTSRGGTRISSAYDLMLDELRSTYRPSNWNVYGFHFSDGDNAKGDMEDALQDLNSLLDQVRRFGFCSIRPGESDVSTPIPQQTFKGFDKKSPVKQFAEVEHPRYAFTGVSETKDLAGALEALLAEELEARQ